jgi:phospholipid/cholesterol/gamma-HCH transport system substrate-binding protein
METRAPYALIGLFVLAVIAAVFGFVYWLHNTGGLAERTYYRIRFEHSVSGMLVGAAVLFNGIRVGEVTELKLDPANPNQVVSTIGVAAATPIRSDTKAGIEFQGLTGVAVVALDGGDPKAPALAAAGSEPPLIASDPNAWQSMTQAARTVLQRLDTVLTENAAAFKSAIANINTFSEALARNSGKIDGIIAGLERMTGGGAAAATATYDLVAPRDFPPPGKPSQAQLTVAEPTGVLMLDTQKILVRPRAPDDPSFEAARWSDTLGKLIQAKILQSFENSHYLGAVARPFESLNSDYQLLIEIRAFQVTTAPEPTAVVELSAKLLGEGGRIKASRVFRGTAPAKISDAAAAAAALNAAFGTVAKDIVIWAAEAINAA